MSSSIVNENSESIDRSIDRSIREHTTAQHEPPRSAARVADTPTVRPREAERRARAFDPFRAVTRHRQEDEDVTFPACARGRVYKGGGGAAEKGGRRTTSTVCARSFLALMAADGTLGRREAKSRAVARPQPRACRPWQARRATATADARPPASIITEKQRAAARAVCGSPRHNIH